MIRLGWNDAEKCALIDRYRQEHGVRNTVILSPDLFALTSATGVDRVEYTEIIQYRHYYRLLREIGRDSLVVVNECLRSQNRHDLTYNCIRNFLNQTRHQIIFQRLPLIDTFDDFMVLFDFDTRSRYKRQRFDSAMLDEVDLEARLLPIKFEAIDVPTPPSLHDTYRREKERLFAALGTRDPHTLPRNLYLVAGRAKVSSVDQGLRYLGRNGRFQLPNLLTYKEAAYPDAPYVVFELPHNFIDFADIIALSDQARFQVLVTELKADRWYFERFQQWSQRVENAYATLHR